MSEARLPTTSQNYFKDIYLLILCQGIFGPVPCFSSMNQSLDTPGVTCFFIQLRHASGSLYDLKAVDTICNYSK